MAFPTLGRGSLSWRLIGFFLLSWLGSLLVFRTALGSKLEQNQIEQSTNILAHNISLSELALERYPPAAVSTLNGYRLLVAHDPNPEPGNGDSTLVRQLALLEPLLCNRLGHCPELQLQRHPERGIWIRLISPLEPVWLFFPLPSPRFLSTDPLLLSLSLITGSVMAGGLFLVLEVRRPMRRLEKAMAQIRSGTDGQPAPASGAQEVRQLSEHFNAMLARLQASERERQTMLAGIAHDLNSPLTRLKLRLQGGPEAQSTLCLDRQAQGKLAADLDALGRITQQFLLYAGSGSREAFVAVPLHSLLQELSGRYDERQLELELAEVEASVQPIAMARAISNLVDNALEYGAAPRHLRLRQEGSSGYAIEVIDAGPGIPEQAMARALEPFQRLDRARRGEGHCGLGLAIAERTAQAHGGRMVLETVPTAQGGGLCARFIGQCQPAALS